MAIDSALVFLLADRESIRVWLRKPQRLLYGVSPLAAVLASDVGQAVVCRALVAEAALARDTAAIAALPAL